MEMPTKAPTVFFPPTHHGVWKGANRLWMMDPDNPSRSDGSAEVGPQSVTYTWEHEGVRHTGTIDLKGQPHALKANLTDTFHAAAGLTLHGFMRHGRINLYGTYPAGDYGEWGWIIELDMQDREHFFVRMYNVIPGHDPVTAVVFQSSRQVP